MKATLGLACCLLFACVAGLSERAPARVGPQQREKFSALAYLPSGAGRAMVRAGATANVDLYINSYTTDEEAKELAAALVDGGPDVLLKALEKSESKGKVTLTGRVGFYDLKLIRSRPTETGRRIYALGDRPISFLEAYNSGLSMDYAFGILMLDLKTDKKGKGKEKGEGVLIYAAKVKVLDGNRLDIENYGVAPVRLMGVRKL